MPVSAPAPVGLGQCNCPDLARPAVQLQGERRKSDPAPGSRVNAAVTAKSFVSTVAAEEFGVTSSRITLVAPGASEAVVHPLPVSEAVMLAPPAWASQYCTVHPDEPAVSHPTATTSPSPQGLPRAPISRDHP